MGERQLGAQRGVLGTTIGMLKGREVVEVEYDPEVLELERLVAMAVELKCAAAIFTRTARDAERARCVAKVESAEFTEEPVDAKTRQQVDLSKHPDVSLLPLTRAQATRLNARAADEDDLEALLSPAQRALRERLAKRLESDKEFSKSIQAHRGIAGLAGAFLDLEARLR